VKHVGCAGTPAEIEALKIKAREELTRIVLENQLSLFPNTPDLPQAKLLRWHITGFHQVFGHVYDRIGFPDNLLRDLVVARIVYPKSKTATIRYLARYIGIDFSKDRVYRFLDRLDKDELTRIAFRFVSQRNSGISLVFYDVTTLYFETDSEDSLKKKGYSKDHRSDTAQILVGLFVDHDGYPFDFDFFKGNTFEGNTFPIAMEKLTKKYSFDNLTVVADAGMFSDVNLSFLEKNGIDYIVGARLKNLPGQIKDMITTHDFAKNSIHEIRLEARRLIVDFSKERAAKDRSNRERLIKKLEAGIAAGRQLVRKSKYLSLEHAGKVTGIDKTLVREDARLDGLKGYITTLKNPTANRDIITQYHNLWKVEKAFRMAKGDLRERPIYHHGEKKIESHLLVCFVSLLVMKETEKILQRKQFSIAKAVEILGKVGQGQIRIGKVQLKLDSELDQESQSILKLFDGH